MADCNYHPNRLLFRADSAGQIFKWNSTDSEYHYNKNKSKIDSHYTADNVTYTYNDMGYRTINFNKLPKQFVLAFGCSYTEGVGVTDTETWPAYLERAIECAVINLGMGGTGMHFQLLNATQWIKNKMPLPKAVVLQIPEVTRQTDAWISYNQYWQFLAEQEHSNINFPDDYTSIFVKGTKPSMTPGDIQDRDMYSQWRDYAGKFPAEPTAGNYEQNQDVTAWFMNSSYATTFQCLWNSVGVPVLQMTYDDDGDVIYNPFNVFRITGEPDMANEKQINQDFGRDGAHAGYRTHQALAEAIAPGVKDMFAWDGKGRQKHDIVRLPQDLTHKTLNEAHANLDRFERKKGTPFIYE